MPARELTIAGRTISDDTDAYVIAEIGHNHGGDLREAEELLRKAAEAGAHAAKLQKRDNKALFTAKMYNEPYTGRNSFGPTYGTHREALEFGWREYTHLAPLAAELGIDFISTAFDFPSVDFLVELDVPAIKMASADLTNTPLLTYAATTGKPLIVSTGGADMDEVRHACADRAGHRHQVARRRLEAVPDLRGRGPAAAQPVARGRGPAPRHGRLTAATGSRARADLRCGPISPAGSRS